MVCCKYLRKRNNNLKIVATFVNDRFVKAALINTVFNLKNIIDMAIVHLPVASVTS